MKPLHPKTLCNRFVAAVTQQALPHGQPVVESATQARFTFLSAIQTWTNTHLGQWSEKAARQFQELAALDLTLYPLELSSLKPDEERAQLLRYPPTTRPILAMRIGGLLWDGVSVYTSTFCPRDCSVETKLLVDAETGAPVFECDVCGFATAQPEQGVRWSGGPLEIPTRRVIHAMLAAKPDLL